MRKTIIEPWILHNFLVRGYRNSLIDSKKIKQYGEQRILEELVMHGIKARIITETSTFTDHTDICINEEKQNIRKKPINKDITYIIERI